MKKLFFVGAVVFGTLSLSSCDNQGRTGTDSDETVVRSDTVVSEYEVQETIIETDTSTRTETIDRDTRDNPDDNRNRTGTTGTTRP
jgi:hypothetical protein